MFTSCFLIHCGSFKAGPEKRCWNNVHETWRKFVMHKSAWSRKKEEGKSFVETFFSPLLIIIPLSPHKFNKFSSFSHTQGENENCWSDKESSGTICRRDLTTSGGDEDGVKWIDVNSSLRAVLKADFFFVAFAKINSQRYHKSSVFSSWIIFREEHKGLWFRWSHMGNHQMFTRSLEKLIQWIYSTIWRL